MADKFSLLKFNPIRIPVSAARKNEAMIAALELELTRFASDLRKDFAGTVKDWEDKPKFTVKSNRIGNKIEYEVFTTSKKYLWLNNGTKPHPIRPRYKKALQLKGYNTKSTVVIVVKRAGSVSSSGLSSRSRRVVRQYVRKHSIRPRRYDKKIIAKRKPTFSTRMHVAMKAALKGP